MQQSNLTDVLEMSGIDTGVEGDLRTAFTGEDPVLEIARATPGQVWKASNKKLSLEVAGRLVKNAREERPGWDASTAVPAAPAPVAPVTAAPVMSLREKLAQKTIEFTRAMLAEVTPDAVDELLRDFADNPAAANSLGRRFLVAIWTEYHRRPLLRRVETREFDLAATRKHIVDILANPTEHDDDIVTVEADGQQGKYFAFTVEEFTETPKYVDLLDPTQPLSVTGLGKFNIQWMDGNTWLFGADVLAALLEIRGKLLNSDALRINLIPGLRAHSLTFAQLEESGLDLGKTYRVMRQPDWESDVYAQLKWKEAGTSEPPFADNPKIKELQDRLAAVRLLWSNALAQWGDMNEIPQYRQEVLTIKAALRVMGVPDDVPDDEEPKEEPMPASAQVRLKVVTYHGLSPDLGSMPITNAEPKPQTRSNTIYTQGRSSDIYADGKDVVVNSVFGGNIYGARSVTVMSGAVLGGNVFDGADVSVNPGGVFGGRQF